MAPDRTADKKEKVKRPPNPWILFRSDCYRAILEEQKRNPHAPRETQAQISTRISILWANADEPTKKYYEARALAAKHDHERENPGWRFKPVRREERERLKAQERDQKKAKAERERQRRQQSQPAGLYQSSSPTLHSSALSSAPSSLPYPINSIPSSNLPISSSSVGTLPTQALVPPPPSPLHNSLAGSLGTNWYGPSPPVSAASSPYSVNQDLAEDDQEANLLHAPPPPDAAAGPDQMAMNDHLPPQLAPQVSWNSGELEPAGQWGDGYNHHLVQDNFLQLNIAEPSASGESEAAAQFEQNLQAIINSSGNASIFTLNNFDAEALDVGLPLDLSLGNNDIDFSMFSDFDWANLALPENTFSGPSTQYQEPSPPSPLFVPAPPYTEYEDNMSQYLDFDAGSSSRRSSQSSNHLHLPSPTTVSDGSEFAAQVSSSSYAPDGQSRYNAHASSSSASAGTSTSSSYAPPAVYTGQRRAGGTWKVPPGLSGSAVQPWKVRA